MHIAPHLPTITEWVLNLPRPPERPLMLGINGPQGSGKSRLAAELVTAAQQKGLSAFTCSIDDFYLTYSEQKALAQTGHRLLEHRGYPGTHDIALGLRTLQNITQRHPTPMPRYNKSAFAGRGDRMPPQLWPHVPPLDLLIFEGWMLGFQPTTPIAAELEYPNHLLNAYQPWWTFIDATLLLKAADIQHVVQWRLQAEQNRRANGETALSDAETLDYIQRFLPAYHAWLPGLYANPPGKQHAHTLLGPARWSQG